MAKAGRHSMYKKIYIERVDEYIALCSDKEVGILKRRNSRDGKKKITEYSVYESKLKVRLPTIDDFALFIGVSRKTLYNWRDKHGDFAYALEKIEIEQKSRLINEGLAGNYNSTISKLILSANHGLRERTDVTTDDEPINPFSNEQIDRIAERLAGRRRGARNTPVKKKSN